MIKIKKAELLYALPLSQATAKYAFTEEKHEQFTPIGREPSSLVLSG